MESQPSKYPRTVHLPWSNPEFDDIIINRGRDFSLLQSLSDIIVTEKLDGQIYSIYKNYAHARSLEDNHHASASYIKSAIIPNIQALISENMRINGEYMYPTHSIYYDQLKSYFYIHSIFIGATVLSWDETCKISDSLNFPVTPVLYRGIYDEKIIKKLYTGKSQIENSLQEGYVIRNAEKFRKDDWQQNVAKYVRPNHVTKDTQNWQLRWNENKINKLKGN